MSHKQNDIYLEELREQEEETQDAKRAYLDALQESYEAQRWLETRYNKWQREKARLQTLTEKE